MNILGREHGRAVAASAGQGTSRLVVLALGGAAVYLLLCILWRDFTYEDAFISYRYARHIAMGIGPIWNLADTADPVEGFTSFLHVWALAIAAFVTRLDVELLGKWMGVVAGLGAIAVLAHELRRRSASNLGALVALSFFALPYVVLNSVSGMETMLFTFFHLLAVITCARAIEEGGVRQVRLFVLFGLLGTLSRPEFGAGFLILSGFLWCSRAELRTVLFRSVLLYYVVPGVLLTAWRYGYYGDVLPNPFHRKQRTGLTTRGMIFVLKFLLVCAVPYFLLILAGVQTLWKTHRALFWVVTLATLVPTLYFTTVIPMMGWWYRFLLPQLLPLTLLAGVAVSDRGARLFPAFRALVPLGLATLVIVPVLHVPHALYFVPYRAADDANFRELARRIAPFAAPGRWLDYYDIGRLPFDSEWNTIDVVGLNTRSDRIRSPCVMRTDLHLRSWSSMPAEPKGEIPNPCPQLYEPLGDLRWIRRGDGFERYMRIFVRKDVPDKEALRHAILDGWPGPISLTPGWVDRLVHRYHLPDQN